MQQIPRGVYTKEFREQAVRLVLEEAVDPASGPAAIDVAPDLGQLGGGSTPR